MKLTHRYWKAKASALFWARIRYFSLRDKLVICRYWLLTRFAEMAGGAEDRREFQAASRMDRRFASSALWLGEGVLPSVRRCKSNVKRPGQEI
jgi:hypothetical protein